MYNDYRPFQCPYYGNTPVYNSDNMYNNNNNMNPYPYFVNTPMYNSGYQNQLLQQYIPYANETKNDYIKLKDYGPEPFVVNIEEATTQNNNFRLALWTG